MLSNRLIRALVGVVVTQASMATAWYLYKKEQEFLKKQNEKTSDDLNALETKPSVKEHDLTPAIQQVESYLKAKEDLKNTTNMKEAAKAQEIIDSMNVTIYESAPEVKAAPVPESKPKRVRKPRVVSQVAPEVTKEATKEVNSEVTKEAPKQVKVPNKKTVAAMKEAEEIVQAKKTRQSRAKPKQPVVEAVPVTPLKKSRKSPTKKA